MNTFESMSEEEKLQYAHALERKGRELIELLLRKRRLTDELGPFLAAGDQETLLKKIHDGIDGRIVQLEAKAVVIEVRPNTDPGAATPDAAIP